jgi:5-methylcytosine-specific restriction protein A
MAAPAPDVLDAVSRVSVELRSLVDLLGAATPCPETIAAVEAAGRLMDAARVRVAAPLARDPLAAEHLGFASAVAAVASLAQVSERTARVRLGLAGDITADLSISGAPIPPARMHLAEAIDTGQVGLDAAALVARQLDAVAARVPTATLEAAERVMVNLAAGRDAAGQRELPPVSVDHLATEIRQIGSAIDPDGARPREERAARRRAFHVGAQDDDGLFPIGGRLVPEVGVLLLGMIEAHRRSPRFVAADDALGPVDHLAGADLSGADPRTADQRRHDAFAQIVFAANSSKDAPSLDGAPVTVAIIAQQADLDRDNARNGDPIATMAGSQFPVSRAQLERFTDANGYRVISKTMTGQIVGISSQQRCFTNTQRLSIAARDGYRCARPGCSSPHYALQVHHVVPYRDGGTTTTDNGILLCYWDHQRIDDGPWRYRMVGGVPQVRGPGIRDWTPLRANLAHAA